MNDHDEAISGTRETIERPSNGARDCGSTSLDVAISAKEAIEAAARACPDLITADVELRRGCGITAVQSICSEQPIPVLFVTGTPGEVRISMPRHALVEKPFSAAHIVDATRLALENRNG